MKRWTDPTGRHCHVQSQAASVAKHAGQAHFLTLILEQDENDVNHMI